MVSRGWCVLVGAVCFSHLWHGCVLVFSWWWSLSLSPSLSLSLSLSLCLSVCLSLSLCVCRNLDKAEPKYKSKAPLAYVQGTTKFYTEAIAKSKIVVTEGDAMQT